MCVHMRVRVRVRVRVHVRERVRVRVQVCVHVHVQVQVQGDIIPSERILPTSSCEASATIARARAFFVTRNSESSQKRPATAGTIDIDKEFCKSAGAPVA